MFEITVNSDEGIKTIHVQGGEGAEQALISALMQYLTTLHTPRLAVRDGGVSAGHVEEPSDDLYLKLQYFGFSVIKNGTSDDLSSLISHAQMLEVFACPVMVGEQSPDNCNAVIHKFIELKAVSDVENSRRKGVAR